MTNLEKDILSELKRQTELNGFHGYISLMNAKSVIGFEMFVKNNDTFDCEHNSVIIHEENVRQIEIANKVISNMVAKGILVLSKSGKAVKLTRKAW